MENKQVTIVEILNVTMLHDAVKHFQSQNKL